MDFDLDNLNPGTRFYFDDADESKGYVDLRVCPSDVVDDITDRTTTTKVEYKRGQRFEVMRPNRTLHRKLLWDYVITGWGNVTNKGKPLECTSENKVAMMGGSVFFSGFVTEKLEVLSGHAADQARAAEKN